MTHDSKISELLRLIDVPPSEESLVRRNYETLAEAEIDARLARLRGAAEVIDQWKRHHHLTEPAVKDSAIDLPIIEGAAPTGTPAAALIPAALAFAAAAVPESPAKTPEVSKQRKRTTSKMSAWEMIVSQHPLLATRENPQLTPGELLDAVARLANVVKIYKPQVIIGLNEGYQVGRILNDHLGIGARLIKLTGAATSLNWNSVTPHSETGIICIAGHVAATGKTLSEAIETTRIIFGTDKVFGIVLAASVDAARHFWDAPDVRYHQIFGTLSHHRAVSFGRPPLAALPAKTFINTSQKLIRKRYPVNPMPWDITR